MNHNFQVENLLTSLKASSLFSGVRDYALDSLCEKAQTIQCNKEEYIPVNPAETGYFYVVESGSFMLSRIIKTGDRHVIDIVNRGGILGVTQLFNPEQTDHVFVEAVRKSLLWRIPISALQEIIDKDHTFIRNLVSINLNVRFSQELELEHRAIQNASQRIGCFVLNQCIGVSGTSVSIKLPYNKNAIAAKLSMRPETFSRALQTLKADTGVQTRGSQVFIQDLDRLKTYVCEFCSQNYPCNANPDKTKIY